MHSETIEQFRHSHDHVMVGHHEKRTRWVVAITAAMMTIDDPDGHRVELHSTSTG